MVEPIKSDFAFVSLGSNLPFSDQDPIEILSKAFAQLEQLSEKPLLTSSIYITSPVDSPKGTPDFYNAVAGLIPYQKETPHSLLVKLQAIENTAGRTRSGTRNEARTLDLDLITFRDEILNTNDLVLPHPRAHQRRFVLEPLMEIAGNKYIFPNLRKTIAESLIEISISQEIRKYQKQS